MYLKEISVNNTLPKEEDCGSFPPEKLYDFLCFKLVHISLTVFYLC